MLVGSSGKFFGNTQAIKKQQIKECIHTLGQNQPERNDQLPNRLDIAD